MSSLCSPQQAQRLLEDPQIQCLDVREYPEYAAGHVPGARLIPLGTLPQELSTLDQSRPLLLLCKGGKRAGKAAEILTQAGFAQATVVEGGTDAWAAAGLPLEKPARAPWSLERQVRLAAGLLVVAGLFIPPWPYLSAFVGTGLAFAALTNTCGMAMLLAKMPWNQKPGCSGGCCKN